MVLSMPSVFLMNKSVLLCFSSRSAGVSEPTSPTSLRSATSTEVVCSSPEYAEDAAVPARDSRVTIRAHFFAVRVTGIYLLYYNG